MADRKLSDSAGLATAGVGYLSTLGLPFAADLKDIQRTFRSIALVTHPDKQDADSSEAKSLTNRFQAAATAYQVLQDESSRRAYMAMYRIRCYLFQQPHSAGLPLAPFYAFHIHKKDGKGIAQQRLLTLDLIAGTLQNWKKDAPHRCIPINHIKEVRVTGPCSFTLCFAGQKASDKREYKLSTESASICELYMSVLRAIVEKGVQLPTDDASFPPPSLRKGYVEKAGRGGDWTRRWLILGASNLLIFRDASCEKMVNAIPLDATVSAVQAAGDGSWSMQAAGRKWSFRNTQARIASAWVAAVLGALQKPAPTYCWLLPEIPSAGREEAASTIDRLRGPSLIHTDEDLREMSRNHDEDSPVLLDPTLEAAAEAEEASGARGVLARPLGYEQELDSARQPSADAQSTARGGKEKEGGGMPSARQSVFGRVFSLFHREAGTTASGATASEVARDAETFGRAVAGQLGQGNTMVRNFL
jgi:curved DNA-binding protein CbpA